MFNLAAEKERKQQHISWTSKNLKTGNLSCSPEFSSDGGGKYVGYNIFVAEAWEGALEVRVGISSEWLAKVKRGV